MDLAILKERIVSLILSESLKEELEEAVKSKHVSILLVAFFFCKQCHEGIFMHNLKLEVMGSSVYLCTRWPQHTIKMGDLCKMSIEALTAVLELALVFLADVEICVSFCTSVVFSGPYCSQTPWFTNTLFAAVHD